MKKVGLVLLIVVVAGLMAGASASAQGEGLTLRMSRDWGYGGLNGDIQGTFTMKASGPSDLARVEFYIDETKIGEATSAPFNLQFVTDDYPQGVHALHAVGFTAGGQELRSQDIGATFVPKSSGSKMLLRIVGPLLGVILGALLLTLVLSLATGRKAKSLPPGTPRQYPLGGGICPKCRRPVALQLLGLNMVAGKLQRCPYCGKWSVIRRASMEQLRAAEQAELEATREQIPAPSEEDRLRKELDDSKYVGG